MLHVKEQVALAPYTTLKVGGPARYLAEVHSVEELQEARQFALENTVPILVLGHGSNVLINDGGYDGLVIINMIDGLYYHDGGEDVCTVTCGAGLELDAVIADTTTKGYWGLENLSHIPGTIGATPIQNVGAYGVEVADRIVSVQACSIVTGEERTFLQSECQFGYRNSYFKTDSGRDWIITSVTYMLFSSSGHAVVDYKDLAQFVESHDEYDPVSIRDEVIRIRSNKFPDWQSVGTAGSWFKNPTITTQKLEALLSHYPNLPHYEQLDGSHKVPLGWILDNVCGLRGFARGAVGLSEHQALVVINQGDSAQAIQEFTDFVAKEVLDKTGISIHPEVRSV